ncbi:MAG: primosomal protein N' [Treponema sp.]|nr:primosomal protein N' [Treponema sp.]
MSCWVEVLFNIPLHMSFTYKLKQGQTCSVGMRVEVPFGRRQKVTSYVIKVFEKLPESFNFDISKLKEVNRIIDKEPIFDESFIELALWISQFYLCSHGEALSAMLPSGRRESKTASDAFVDDFIVNNKLTLSQEQINAVSGITENNNKYYMHYLYGSTGSGKTEVFLQCADFMIAQNKGVIYLVPEIALTTQVVEAVTSRFGKTAAVLHSGLTPSQKLSEWRRIISKEAYVVVGARSAVFAPVPDLGMIIIDEEHDGSYKSGTTPRYHARQVAMKRCASEKIPLVMGSATPSAESWALMNDGRIIKHILTKRLAGGKMPEIVVVDLLKETLNGCISFQLEKEINESYKEKRQSILFLNRRGFTHFFKCKTCGFELFCKNCSVPMTFHKNEGRLRCHYCGWTEQQPTVCPKCNSIDVGYSGFGTEFIENELATKFPHLRTIRIDTDSLTKRGELQEKIEIFKNGGADILLGTQMIAKGLNFPGVKLVGIINADTALHMPDFRAEERTFSLIVQVAGRAGRYFPDGKVIVQTWNPTSNSISKACSGDFENFYNEELKVRKNAMFPPYSRLIRLTFRSKNQKYAENSAMDGAKILQGIASNVEILGPSECALSLISSNYRYQILLRNKFLSPIQKICTDFLNSYKTPQGVYIEVDVDPVSLL